VDRVVYGAQTAVGSVGAGGTEVALYAKGTELLSTQPFPVLMPL